MKRLSEKIRPFSLALVLLMPVTIESDLLAEVNLEKVFMALNEL